MNSFSQYWSSTAVYIFWAVNLVLIIINLIAGKKVRFLPIILTTLFITFFSLLTPHGQILFEYASFRITKDALFEGLKKSAVLTFTVLLSKLIVSAKLKLPGKPGEFLNKVFEIYDALISKPVKFNPKKLISQVDERLMEIWENIQ